MVHRLKALAVVLMIGFASITSVFAHAKMATTIPADGAYVAAGLSEIELAFTKPMRLTVLKITRSDDGQRVTPSDGLPKTFAKAARIMVPPLTFGAYRVNWTAVANDGHVMSGQFVFTIDEGIDIPFE